MLFPEWYPDYEYKKHTALQGSLDVLAEAFRDFGELTGRTYGPIESDCGAGARIVLLGLGSMMQTARATAADLRRRGVDVGVINLRTFRPLPEEAMAQALRGVDTVVVLDRDIGYGTSGMVYPDVTRVLYHAPLRPRLINCVIGTGGKDITPKTIERCVELAQEDHGAKSVFWPDARGPAEGIAWTEAPSPASTPAGA